MKTGIKNVVTIVGGAFVVALVAFVIFDATESGERGAPMSTSGIRPHEEDDLVPLPSDLVQLEALVEFAQQDARRWRPDARLVRLYATEARCRRGL